MSNYSAIGSMALIAGDTVLAIIASTTARPKIFHVLASSSSSPNDYSAHFHGQRFSADGTGTAVTPQPLGGLDERAAVATAKDTYTAEPTVTADEIPLNFAHNQRGTWQFVATPGAEITIPALAGDGLAIVCKAVSTQFTEEMTIHFSE